MYANNILISICVPTFNRLNFLKQLIHSLEEQDFETHQIELCISDNASSDSTRECLEKLSLDDYHLLINVNSENCGLEQNMITVMRMASGKYILPIGDDDCFMPDSIKAIIKSLENSPDLLILNGFNTDNDLNIESEYMPQNLKNKEYHDPIVAFPNLWSQMRPGAFVVKSDILDLDEQTGICEKYIGTSHTYSALPWEGLAQKYVDRNYCKIICMEQPTILFRNGPKTWSEQKMAILFSEIPEWFERLPGLYDSVKYKERQKYMNTIAKIQMLLSMRAIGILNSQSIQTYMNKYSKKQQRLARLICLLPISAAGSLQNIKQFIKSLFFKSESISNS